MKRCNLMLVIFFVVVWCASPGAASQWQVLSQLTFTRGKGNPITETVPFSALRGEATLKVVNSKVSSATVAVNGQVIFGPSDFNQKVVNLEKRIPLNNGQNTLEVVLKSQPGSQITVGIVQEVPEVTPQIVRLQTANALRVGDIGLVLQGFLQDEDNLSIIPALDAAKRKQLADMLENAVIELETETVKYYMYPRPNDPGGRIEKFAMATDGEKWLITKW